MFRDSTWKKRQHTRGVKVGMGLNTLGSVTYAGHDASLKGPDMSVCHSFVTAYLLLVLPSLVAELCVCVFNARVHVYCDGNKAKIVGGQFVPLLQNVGGQT